MLPRPTVLSYAVTLMSCRDNTSMQYLHTEYPNVKQCCMAQATAGIRTRRHAGLKPPKSHTPLRPVARDTDL